MPASRDSLSVPLSAGRKLEVTCETWGARPPALVSWSLQGPRDAEPIPIAGHLSRTTTTQGGNVSTSVLAFMPHWTDNGRSLKCSAANKYLDPLLVPPLVDKWVLDVHCKYSNPPPHFRYTYRAHARYVQKF